DGSWPAGCAAVAVDPCAGAGESGAVWRCSYGFQKLPPITSAISTLYDWYRSSTVAIRFSVSTAIVDPLPDPCWAAMTTTVTLNARVANHGDIARTLGRSDVSWPTVHLSLILVPIGGDPVAAMMSRRRRRWSPVAGTGIPSQHADLTE